MNKRAAKKPSGENIPEAMRKTEAIKLRLPPDVAAMLRELAANNEMRLNEYVVALLRTMRDHQDELVGSILEDLRIVNTPRG